MTFEAVRHTDFGDWPDDEHPCEALGPNIQGNPLGLTANVCVPFNLSAPVMTSVPRTYEGLRDFLLGADMLRELLQDAGSSRRAQR